MEQQQEREIVHENLSPDRDSISDTKITQEFYTFLKLNNDEATEENGDDEVAYDEEEEEEEEEGEFSFMCGGADTSPISAEEAFINGRIKPTLFPISFNQDHLPTRPPVNNLFVETMSEDQPPHVTPIESSSSSSPETYCKKSNSTGFSKIWRFKDLMGRSNSDGRDAFVFLNNNNDDDNSNSDEAVKTSVRESIEKVLKGKELKKTKGGKTASLSAHEVYLRRSKAKAGEERRRSYLPYRPGLMGFFTNVSGGLLTKNVHPY